MSFRAKIVQTTETQLIGPNPKRTAVIFKNTSAQTVFISRDRSRIVEEGFPLETTSVFTLIARDGDNPTEAIYAQVAATTADVRISEQFGFPKFGPEG